MEELKKELALKLIDLTDEFGIVDIKDLASWIEQKIKEAKISENKYWIERLDLEGSRMVSVWADDFLYHIEELEGE
ncbi:MAG: hypothetical protein M0R03_15645 [Novosphingobium sp.]|nr:hypothetical protein [Novosphingobium sp.]